MLPITDELLGLIILITSCLTINYLTFLLSPKLISLDVINIPTTRRNNAVLTTTNMVSTLEELIVRFPHSTLLKVTGETTFEDLKIIRRPINANAMSVSSYEGCG
jgi:hypothetical protein